MNFNCKIAAPNLTFIFKQLLKVGILRDVIVEGSRNQTITMNSANIGALNVSRDMIAKTPVIFGESDVIKTLQFEPGVSGGVEGTAGMYVHGGNVDENLYMLDNIPLYQVNHFGGLFSAFNTEAIKNVDFYKSTFPAKFDGRLSSFMDVYTRDGSNKKLNGSIRIGLTSGAANIEGPLWKDKTTFSLAVRRSWFELITIPAVAIANSVNGKGDDDFTFGYAFTDVNAKIAHKFSNRSKIYGMFYYGEDYLKNGTHTPDDKKGDYDDNNDGLYSYGTTMWLDYDAEPLFTEHVSSLESAVSETSGYTFFSDRMIAGKTYPLHIRLVNVCYPVSADNNFDSNKSYVKFVLSSISESYYKHVISVWESNDGINGILGGVGLADPVWECSNVSTGAGVISASAPSKIQIPISEFFKDMKPTE